MKPSANLETTVGIFLLCGLGIICTLIIFFGEMPDLFNPIYTLTVQFPDASGLLRGGNVYVSGALIGKVVTDPYPIPDTQRVGVELKIDQDIAIRQDASFTVGRSGFLGDKFVEVKPKEYQPGEKMASFVRNGQVLEGAEMASIQSLMDNAEPLLNRANHMAAQLDDIFTRLNTDVLSGTSANNLKNTIAKLPQLVGNGNRLLANANDILAQIKTGQGALGRLICDKQVGNNLAAFTANLRVHGPVFYHDDTAEKGVSTSDMKDGALAMRKNMNKRSRGHSGRGGKPVSRAC